MAAAFTAILKCRICGSLLTITNALEAVYSKKSATKGFKCARCGANFPFEFTSITAQHSGNIGAFVSLVQVISKGTISSSTPT